MILLGGLIAALAVGCAAGETGSPSNVTESAAAVGGRVVSDVGGDVEYWAQYGRTTAYGSETAHATVTTEPSVPRAVFGVEIGGLARNTTYHYRLCARDSQQSGGPGCGRDLTFTTQSFACGETVTGSVRLTHDLVCGFEGGLVIGAAGIDVNLAGHSLSGPIASGGGGPAGILNSGGHADVTIRNGELGGWGNAVRLQGTSRNRIRDVVAAGAGAAIVIEGGDANEIRASTIFGRSGGIAASRSARLTVAGNRASGAFSPAIRVDGELAYIVRNQVPREGDVFPLAAGVEVTGSGHRIADNRVTGSWGGGGILVRAGSDNVLRENEVSGGMDPGLTPTSDPIGDGIFVGPFTAGTLLRGNLAQSNRGDGIEVQAAGARLTDNRAVENGDFGIDAAAGVTDLGGNSASGNGNPLQCRNVFCG